MISFVSGTIASIDGDVVVVDAGALGFAVQIPERSAIQLAVGDDVRLHTVLVPREDALLLFGFATEMDRRIFNVLRGVSGVGPKTALAALSGLGAEQIVTAARMEDAAAFRSIPGIGPKTAKLIVVQLADKLEGLGPDAPVQPGGQPAAPAALEAVVGALVGLGWSEREARDAAEGAVAHGVPVEESLRAALRRLGPQR